MSRLAQILAAKADDLAVTRARKPLSVVRSQAEAADAPRGFARALREAAPRMALIAEVKKASPSQGLIRDAFDPVAIAQAYESAGAHALSVLTDEKFFMGSEQNLRLARAATLLPALRKDFTLDAYHIYEARAMGADAVLLIVAALEPGLLGDLHALTHELGMDALVEVHNHAEAETAAAMGAPLVGVNNRDLATFTTRLETTEELAPALARNAFVVSESSLASLSDVERAREAGAMGVLIGTTFCGAPDIASKVLEVMGWQ